MTINFENFSIIIVFIGKSLLNHSIKLGLNYSISGMTLQMPVSGYVNWA